MDSPIEPSFVRLFLIQLVRFLAVLESLQEKTGARDIPTFLILTTVVLHSFRSLQPRLILATRAPSVVARGMRMSVSWILPSLVVMTAETGPAIPTGILTWPTRFSQFFLPTTLGSKRSGAKNGEFLSMLHNDPIFC